jgi:predicted DCC family thiol-disulfide oxidoreductase YuxK
MAEQAMFLFDGDCAFCSRCADFIARRFRTAATVMPWQHSDLGTLGLTVDECDSAVQWVRPGRRVEAGPAAIAELLRSSSGAFGLWKLAGLLLAMPPVRALAWPVYRCIARNRDKMPGGTAACALPQAQRGVTPGPVEH